MSKEWPEERVAKLRQLNAEGLSAGRIALALGGVTRNAIIGKLARLGLKSLNGSRGQRLTAEQCQARRDAFNARRREQRAGIAHPPKPAHKPWEGPEITELPPEKSAYAVSLLDAKDGQCRFPIAEPGAPFMFCGAPTVHCSYCAGHCRVAYRSSVRAEAA